MKYYLNNKRETMRTPEEKKQIIQLLEIEKMNIPEYSMFRTPNHKVIDAKIKVINQNLDSEDITESFGEEYDHDNDCEPNDIAIGAMAALSWLDGEVEMDEIVDVE